MANTANRGLCPMKSSPCIVRCRWRTRQPIAERGDGRGCRESTIHSAGSSRAISAIPFYCILQPSATTPPFHPEHDKMSFDAAAAAGPIRRLLSEVAAAAPFSRTFPTSHFYFRGIFQPLASVVSADIGGTGCRITTRSGAALGEASSLDFAAVQSTFRSARLGGLIAKGRRLNDHSLRSTAGGLIGG